MKKQKTSKSTMPRKLTLCYAPDYNSGKAEVVLDAEDFLRNPEHANRNLAKLAAGILATANDRIGELGRAKYLVPALEEVLQFQDISLFSYPRCQESAKVRLEELGKKSWDFAFSISHCPMTARGEEFELILLTLRGTESLSEGIITDFIGTINSRQVTDWCGYRAYPAFCEYAQKVLRGLKQYIQRNRNRFHSRNIKFFLLGHSLGGAAAQLAAAKLTRKGHTVFCYTFASLNPIVSNGTRDYPNIWNFFNAYDTYGPRGWGAFGYRPAGGGKTIYHKLGNVIRFQRDYNSIFVKWKWSKNHVMAGYCHWMGVSI